MPRKIRIAAPVTATSARHAGIQEVETRVAHASESGAVRYSDGHLKNKMGKS
jgi:hypothetical protein